MEQEDYSIKGIDKCLNCTRPECNNCLERTKEPTQIHIAWKPDDIKLLYDLSLDNEEIAIRLNRSPSSVCNKRYRLNIVGYKRSSRK